MSQTSEDWSEEKNRPQKKDSSFASDYRMTEKDQDHHHQKNQNAQGGFTFINHLGVPLTLSIEGYDQYERRKQEAESILKGRAIALIKKDKAKAKSMEEMQRELEKLKKVKNDPRVN